MNELSALHRLMIGGGIALLVGMLLIAINVVPRFVPGGFDWTNQIVSDEVRTGWPFPSQRTFQKGFRSYDFDSELMYELDEPDCRGWNLLACAAIEAIAIYLGMWFVFPKRFVKAHTWMRNELQLYGKCLTSADGYR